MGKKHSVNNILIRGIHPEKSEQMIQFQEKARREIINIVREMPLKRDARQPVYYPDLSSLIRRQ